MDTSQDSGGFIRRITFGAAFDKRDPDPSKNYGIHGVEMRWILIGSRGAVSFVLFTDWQLPHVRKELGQKCRPIPADVSLHSPVRMYEGQQIGDCDILPGGQCFCDGSSLIAEVAFDELIKGGEDGLWHWLKCRYNSEFGIKED